MYKKTFFILCIFIPLFGSFFYINQKNFDIAGDIRNTEIKHPEKLPKAEMAAFMSPGFSNIIADFYWLQAIQYIGQNAVSSEYRKYLYEMMNLITELSPYFESPYVIGELLIPSGNDSNQENFLEEEKQIHVKKGELLGLKGVKNFCDEKKVHAIMEEIDLQKIISDPIYKNPCKSYKIPYYLAYIYFYYKNDNLSASKYYKVVSAQEDAPVGARTLAAIMEGKGGEREKSIFMFLSLAKSLASQENACGQLSQEIEQVYTGISVYEQEISGELLRQIEILRDTLLPKLSEENENIILSDTECSNYLVKAIRELSLLYLETADKKYINDNPGEVSAQKPEKLFEEKYINFIPTDYQQYEDKNYGIIYRYSEEINRFDYKMGNY